MTIYKVKKLAFICIVYLIYNQYALADEMIVGLNYHNKNLINITGKKNNDLIYKNNDSSHLPKNIVSFRYKLENEKNLYYYEINQYTQIQPITQYIKIYFGPLKTFLPIEGEKIIRFDQRNFSISKEYDYSINYKNNFKLIYGGQLSNINLSYIDIGDESRASSYFISPYLRMKVQSNHYSNIPLYMEISAYTSLKNSNYSIGGTNFSFGGKVFSEKNSEINIAFRRQSININYIKNENLVSFSNYGNGLDLFLTYKFN
jgi:hypothetical protein